MSLVCLVNLNWAVDNVFGYEIQKFLLFEKDVVFPMQAWKDECTRYWEKKGVHGVTCDLLPVKYAIRMVRKLAKKPLADLYTKEKTAQKS